MAEETGAHLAISPFRCCGKQWSLPAPPLLETEQIQLPQLFLTFSSPLTSLVALHWTHSRTLISFLKWEAQNWTRIWGVALRGSLIPSAGVWLLLWSCWHSTVVRTTGSYIFFKVKLPSFLSKLTVKLWEHINHACSDKAVFLVTVIVTWPFFSKAAHNTVHKFYGCNCFWQVQTLYGLTKCLLNTLWITAKVSPQY